MTFPQHFYTFSGVARISETLFAAAGVKLPKEGLGVSTQKILGEICAAKDQKYKFMKLILSNNLH